jgi:hypothetical protein
LSDVLDVDGLPLGFELDVFVLDLVNFGWVVQGTAASENNGQKDETVGNTIDNDSEPHLEEGLEDVGAAGGEHNDGKEGGESAMEHARSHRTQCTSCFEYSFLVVTQLLSVLIGFWWMGHEISMTDVCAVINRQSNSYDIIDNGYAVECDSPEVEETQQEHINQSNAQKDEQGHLNVGCHDHDDDEHGAKCQAHVHDCLALEDDVGLELQVLLCESEGVTKLGRAADLLHVVKNLNTLGG